MKKQQTILRQFSISPDFLNGKAILITGGTGSFGQALVRLLATHYKPRRVVIFSRDEMKQHEMAQRVKLPDTVVRFFIGDVRDADRLEFAMRDIDYVIHAAALKHIPAAEYNPFECIHTNVFGAENVVKAAIRTGVKRVIALSTDKATNPINLYGASKLASDKIFIAGNSLSGRGGPRFAVVRYGNVLGSRGSVVPFFERLITEGADSLPITDVRMTRFWISLSQATGFVLSNLNLMRGGEIFIPKIPSMKVVDLATAMAPHLPQKIVGIRPGEKLHEVMITPDDARLARELPDRYVIEPAFPFWSNAHLLPDAKPLPENFTYSSDKNSEWIDLDGMRSMLKEWRGQ